MAGFVIIYVSFISFAILYSVCIDLYNTYIAYAFIKSATRTHCGSYSFTEETKLLQMRICWAPNGTRLTARYHFTGLKKVSISMAQPPPTCPRNGFARIKSIAYMAV
jgi:hypothetical protein